MASFLAPKITATLGGRNSPATRPPFFAKAPEGTGPPTTVVKPPFGNPVEDPFGKKKRT